MKKAITIKQPWGYLICAGIKDIENRTWNTKYRGRVYIHTSATKVKDHWSLLSQQQYNTTMNYLLDNNIKPLYSLSAIIGHVDIIDCVWNHSSIWAEPDCFHWILRNPVLYDEPIRNVKGKLSFWDCSEYIDRKEASNE